MPKRFASGEVKKEVRNQPAESGSQQSTNDNPFLWERQQSAYTPEEQQENFLRRPITELEQAKSEEVVKLGLEQQKEFLWEEFAKSPIWIKSRAEAQERLNALRTEESQYDMQHEAQLHMEDLEQYRQYLETKKWPGLEQAQRERLELLEQEINQMRSLRW